jgi:DNA replicative helicase MCM subunit Mcm2 (Cdc46/Mcm family)
MQIMRALNAQSKKGKGETMTITHETRTAITAQMQTAHARITAHETATPAQVKQALDILCEYVAQTIQDAQDGYDVNVTAGWSYADYIVMELDSVDGMSVARVETLINAAAIHGVEYAALTPAGAEAVDTYMYDGDGVNAAYAAWPSAHAAYNAR